MATSRHRFAHVPIRTCVGCRGRAARCELLRIVACSDEAGLAVVADPRGSAPGRGAYLHPTLECYELAVRRRAFGRALRTPSQPDSTLLAQWLAARATHPDRPR